MSGNATGRLHHIREIAWLNRFAELLARAEAGTAGPAKPLQHLSRPDAGPISAGSDQDGFDLHHHVFHVAVKADLAPGHCVFPVGQDQMFFQQGIGRKHGHHLPV